jgi:hypothetical protein
MTWDLDTLIDLSGSRFECIKALINFFEVDLRSIQYEVIIGEYPNKKILESENLTWDLSILSKLEALLNRYPEYADTYDYMSIGLGLHGYGELGNYSPYPEIFFKRSAHTKGIYAVGQEGDATLLFGNHNAYRSESVLPKSGRLLDRDFVTQTLIHLCEKIQPKNLYLLSEEQVYIPWNYHFIFHNNLDGYAQDIADIIRLMLHGGEGYADGRHDYKAGVSDHPTMAFCKRSSESIEILKEFVLEHGARIEQNGLPQTLSRELVEDALLEIPTIPGEDADPSMDFFFVGEGLGIYTQPLLKRYLDLIFLALMIRVEGTADALVLNGIS